MSYSVDAFHGVREASRPNFYTERFGCDGRALDARQNLGPCVSKGDNQAKKEGPEVRHNLSRG
jgi:hypothetical protein